MYCGAAPVVNLAWPGIGVESAPMTKNVILIASLALWGCAAPRQDASPAAARTETCQTPTEQDISALFDRWNRSLQTGDPQQVLANYAAGSLLLPTLSNKPRTTPAEQADYFVHFLANKPVGTIDWRSIHIDCNTAVDAGLYTFTYGTTGAAVKARYTFAYEWDGRQWLISHHHSSALPEKGVAPQ